MVIKYAEYISQRRAGYVSALGVLDHFVNGDNRTIDLDRVDPALGEMRQRACAGAEIVHDQAYAEILEAIADRESRQCLARQEALFEFEVEIGRLDARSCERPLQGLDKSLADQFLG